MTAGSLQTPLNQANTGKPQGPKDTVPVQAELNYWPSNRMASFADTLLLSGSKEGLYNNILEIAANLLSACQGSVMLVDKDGEDIRVVQTKGINTEIPRCSRVQMGIGIAGNVAKSGIPLLVEDVEKDLSVPMRNRARFKSKSFISAPLKLNDKVLGVLNLSEKRDLTPFSKADLTLLTSFSTLASLMVERTHYMEETCRLEQLSLTDPLTGIYNRRFLNDRIEEEINRSLHKGLEFTVLFIDLDHFKVYNDRFGHLAGDEALKRTAKIIKAALRGMDIVARFGGEEFCVLLPGASKQSALPVAERIREGIERMKIPGGEGLTAGRLTASLGVASFPEDGTALTTLLHASDMALYRAKTTGRNRFVAAHSTLVGSHQPIDSIEAASSLPVKILVVDDSSDVTSVIGVALRREGYQVLTANNGMDGLKIAFSQKPDLILCDALMPMINGYALMRAIKANPATVGIPMILLTSKTSSKEEHRALKSGFRDFISKPMMTIRVVSRVKRTIETMQKNNPQEAAAFRSIP